MVPTRLYGLTHLLQPQAQTLGLAQTKDVYFTLQVIPDTSNISQAVNLKPRDKSRAAYLMASLLADFDEICSRESIGVLGHVQGHDAYDWQLPERCREDLLPAGLIRKWDVDQLIQSARPQQGRVNDVWPAQPSLVSHHIEVLKSRCFITDPPGEQTSTCKLLLACQAMHTVCLQMAVCTPEDEYHGMAMYRSITCRS